jgi:methyltransferase family protein
VKPSPVRSKKPPHQTLKFKLVTGIYRAVPPLKYWGVRQGYLKRIGWVRSNWAHTAVDAAGEPLPWLTYPAIEFLQQRVRPTMKVFEYGSGQSTRWWARHVASVHSVEDDADWYRRVSADLPANADLRLASSSDGAYARSIADRNETFDIVVIDGSVRNDCARVALPYLAATGVIVWDNTEDPDLFRDGLEFLASNGFKQVDFFGLAPLNMDPHATAILYRPGDNCFGM